MFILFLKISNKLNKPVKYKQIEVISCLNEIDKKDKHSKKFIILFRFGKEILILNKCF